VPYSDRPTELPRLLHPIAEGSADITLGSRLGFAADSRIHALSWRVRQSPSRALDHVAIWAATHRPRPAPRRARRRPGHALALEETAYEWAVEMILKGALHGYRILKVPVSYHLRVGQSKIGGTVAGTAGAPWYIFSRILRYYFRCGG
jgi:hypothetical protein